jgi:Druantia protein DruA
MSARTIIQGRLIGPAEVGLIRRLLAEHPDWHRTRLSRELCAIWEWRNSSGRIKDMAARTLLLKLERRGLVVLPPRQSSANNAARNRSVCLHEHDQTPIAGSLRPLLPLSINMAGKKDAELAVFKSLITQHHYLGMRNTVGENLKYLIRDRADRLVGALLFGSAAWQTQPRDAFIGWSVSARRSGLSKITNNTRFLIPGWVRVPHLAGHILSRVSRRLDTDWQEKYGHRIHLLETFVDRDRFRGTCYRAANWICVGQTQGRTRNGPRGVPPVPIKDVFVYPLSKRFRQELCDDPL